MKQVGAMTSLRIGEVARRAGVSVETLRYYERQGILPAPPRRESSYRSYPPETVDVIRFIKRAQALGLSLRDVQELLGLRGRPRAGMGRVRRVIEAKRTGIEGQIRELQALKASLDALLGRCDGGGPVASCPIIAHLNGSDASVVGGQAT